MGYLPPQIIIGVSNDEPKGLTYAETTSVVESFKLKRAWVANMLVPVECCHILPIPL